MDDKISKMIIIINVGTFFLGWNIIFLAGADKPPPIGFLWLVCLVLLLDIAQFFYLKRFLPRLHTKSKGLFFINLFYFFFAGLIVGVITILARINIMSGLQLSDIFIWIVLIISASLVNGAFFYAFNIVLLKKYKNS
ncbi:hypothetical protein ACIQ2D_15315 [Lysinibacillus sp. NPDC097287]|uniref:hypothetical protein n=1 Tax=Lysinibacillus sp. NPDC097287 TaxID=3364144 RepID=UPI00380306D7